MRDEEFIHLDLADVIALHATVLAAMGQPPSPPHDAVRLASAVMRPQMASDYEAADLVHQASLLAAGITEARAFAVGNKRLALAALRLFLRLNGVQVVAPPLEQARQIEALATREGSLAAATDRFEMWLRARVRFG